MELKVQASLETRRVTGYQCFTVGITWTTYNSWKIRMLPTPDLWLHTLLPHSLTVSESSCPQLFWSLNSASRSWWCRAHGEDSSYRWLWELREGHHSGPQCLSVFSSFFSIVCPLFDESASWSVQFSELCELGEVFQHLMKMEILLLFLFAMFLWPIENSLLHVSNCFGSEL